MYDTKICLKGHRHTEVVSNSEIEIFNTNFDTIFGFFGTVYLRITNGKLFYEVV